MGLVKCTYCDHCIYKGDKKRENYKWRCEAKNDEEINDRLEPIKCMDYEHQ